MTSIHYKSTVHPKCPPKPKIVRGDTIIGGYILEVRENKNGVPCYQNDYH